MDHITPELMALALLFGMGLLGGLIRGLIGVYKARVEEGPEFYFDAVLFILPLLISGIMGLVGGVILETGDPKIIIPLGYAGVDAAEGLLKRR